MCFALFTQKLQFGLKFASQVVTLRGVFDSYFSMILGEDPKHVSQLDTILSLSLSICLSPSLRLSLSLVLDLASILVSALVLVLVLVLALGLARRPEAASGSHLEANIGNS